MSEGDLHELFPLLDELRVMADCDDACVWLLLPSERHPEQLQLQHDSRPGPLPITALGSVPVGPPDALRAEALSFAERVRVCFHAEAGGPDGDELLTTEEEESES